MRFYRVLTFYIISLSLGCDSGSKPRSEPSSWELRRPVALSYQLGVDVRAPLHRYQPLTQVAEELHDYVSQHHHLPPSELIEHLLEAYGVPLWGAALWAWGAAPSVQERELRVARISEIRGQEDRGLTRLFGESIRQEGARWGHLVLTAPLLFQLKGASRAQPQALNLRFSLAEGLSKPEALLLNSSGVISRVKVTQEGGRYHVTAHPLLGSGPFTVELLASSSFGLRPLAQLTFNRPQAQLERWSDQRPPEGPPQAQSTAEERAWIVKRLQEERAQRGLSPLQLDSALTQVAQAHAQDMSHAHYFGHMSPQKVSPIDRLRASAYVALLVGENIARHSSLLGAHRSLLRSLGHRKNMLSADYTHVGVGVTRVKQSYLVTQLFALPAPKHQPSDEALLTRGLYIRAKERSPGLRTCEAARHSKTCDQLHAALSLLIKQRGLLSAEAQATPEWILEQSAAMIQSGSISAWVVQTEAIEALQIPSALLKEGGALVFKVQVKPQEGKAWPQIEVWGLSLLEPDHAPD